MKTQLGHYVIHKLSIGELMRMQQLDYSTEQRGEVTNSAKRGEQQ
jgi:hypothetical protein